MISCHLHDYIEIACIYRIAVELILENEKITGIPVNTQVSQGQEYLIIDFDDGQQQIELEKVISMRALIENPHFDQVSFQK